MNIEFEEETRKFIAIEYPGKVQNADKMCETLGGLEELSKGFQEKQKLQLKFRNNFFAKPVLSTEPLETTGMLLKVKVRRSKKHRDQKPEYVSTELLGTISNGYKFNNFADYQYLPIQRNDSTGETENIYHETVPSDISVSPSWFKEKLNVPVFLPPVAFTRSDTMQTTILKNEVKDNEDIEEVRFAVTNRMSRATNGIAIPFSMADQVPILPNDAVKDIITTTTLVTQEDFDEVKRLFQERPIWTLASLRAHMRIPPKRLNYSLAGIAFYYSNGPWRNCFVRLGYDPRKNFESRLYQMLDYRVRQAAGFKEELSKRRPTGINKRVKVPSRDVAALKEESQIEQDHQQRRIEAIFTTDTIPPFRARHYQFIDIHVPKIQEMLAKIPSPYSGALCNEKRGWLPIGFMEQCRDILTEIAQSNMLKHCREKNISLEEFRATEDSISEAPIGEDDEQDSDETDSQFPEDLDDNQDPL